MALTEKLTAIADAIRSKTGKTESMTMEQMVTEIDSIQAGGGGGGSSASVPWNDVTFIDYDGTVLHSYSLAEAQALTELPPLPEQKGLICQGWNWSLEDIKAQNGPVIVGAMYITDDGKTRIYITLHEGRTSPMLGVCPNGTVTVDWGDGTEPDVLTGTRNSTVVWTPNHEYASAGDYVISLSVDGEMGFYGENSKSAIIAWANGSSENDAYLEAVKRIEFGDKITYIGKYSFASCDLLEEITISIGSTTFGQYSFKGCCSLKSIVIPSSIKSLGSYGFDNCFSLKSVSIPKSVNSIGVYCFKKCISLNSIAFPKGITQTGEGSLSECTQLKRFVIPDGVTNINTFTFNNSYCFEDITIPNSVATIGMGAFSALALVRRYDFSSFTSVPTLSNTSAFSVCLATCQFLIPAALYDEWSTATNWATYASYMVAV